MKKQTKCDTLQSKKGKKITRKMFNMKPLRCFDGSWTRTLSCSFFSLSVFNAHFLHWPRPDEFVVVDFFFFWYVANSIEFHASEPNVDKRFNHRSVLYQSRREMAMSLCKRQWQRQRYRFRRWTRKKCRRWSEKWTNEIDGRGRQTANQKCRRQPDVESKTSLLIIGFKDKIAAALHQHRSREKTVCGHFSLCRCVRDAFFLLFFLIPLFAHRFISEWTDETIVCSVDAS